MAKKIFQCKKNDKKVGSICFDSVSEEKAQLFFYGDIVSDSWASYWYEEDKCPQDICDFLSELDGTKAIDIFINSGGGSVSAGLAIYNQLTRYTGKKTVRVDGLAASIASVIALAGDEIIIPSTAQFMIHKPWTYSMGNADDFRTQANALDSCEQAIMAVYMAHTKEGIEEATISQMMKDETWLTGVEAEKYFEIKVEESSELVATASNFFNKYKNTPKSFKEKVKDNKNQILKEELQKELILLDL